MNFERMADYSRALLQIQPELIAARVLGSEESACGAQKSQNKLSMALHSKINRKGSAEINIHEKMAISTLPEILRLTPKYGIHRGRDIYGGLPCHPG